MDRAGIRVRADDNADADVTITNNRIGTVTPVGGTSGSTRDGIELRIRDSAGDQMTVLLEDNTVVINNIRQTIDIDAEDGDTMSVTVLGNTFTNNGAGLSFDIESEDSGSTIELDLNSANVAANRNNSNLGYGLYHTAGTFRIEVDPLDAVVNTPGVGYTDAQTETFFNSRNDGGAVTTPGNQNNFVGLAGVSLP